MILSQLLVAILSGFVGVFVGMIFVTTYLAKLSRDDPEAFEEFVNRFRV